MHRKRNSNRRGSSLILMASTMTAGAVIVGIAVLVLVRMMGFDDAASDHLQRTVVVARLAEQFRTDVAAARSAEVQERPAAETAGDQQDAATGEEANAAPSHRLTLTLGERHTIAYDVRDSIIERTVERDGQRLHYETFAPAGLAALAPELVNEAANGASPQFARLRLKRPSTVESHLPEPARSVVIEAQVGRDHRFAQRPIAQQQVQP